MRGLVLPEVRDQSQVLLTLTVLVMLFTFEDNAPLVTFLERLVALLPWCHAHKMRDCFCRNHLQCCVGISTCNAAAAS